MAGVGVSGDFAALARLQAKLRKLASEDTKLRLSNVLGAASLAEVQKGFRESRDPYGDPWAPLKLRRGKPLLDTGRLRSSFSYVSNRNGFRIGTNFIGARVHQKGATIVPVRAKWLRYRVGRKGPWIRSNKSVIPARPMLPDRGYLGPIWSKAIVTSATGFLSRIMKR